MVSQFSRIFSQPFRNFSQLDLTPPPPTATPPPPPPPGSMFHPVACDAAALLLGGTLGHLCFVHAHVFACARGRGVGVGRLALPALPNTHASLHVVAPVRAQRPSRPRLRMDISLSMATHCEGIYASWKWVSLRVYSSWLHHLFSSVCGSTRVLVDQLLSGSGSPAVDAVRGQTERSAAHAAPSGASDIVPDTDSNWAPGAALVMPTDRSRSHTIPCPGVPHCRSRIVSHLPTCSCRGT